MNYRIAFLAFAAVVVLSAMTRAAANAIRRRAEERRQRREAQLELEAWQRTLMRK